MPKFIYVFSVIDRDKMLERGFRLLYEKDSTPMYVFANNDVLETELSDIPHALSDMLTF